MATRVPAILLALALVVGWAPAAAHEEAGALVIDGDPATRIVRTHPGEPVAMVVGTSGLYASTGHDWERRGDAPPAGVVAWGGGDSAILLAGDHAACLRGGPPIDLMRSADGGTTWQAVAGAQDLRPLAIWPEQGLALAASCAGLQLSSDEGMSWTVLPGVEPGYDLTAYAEVADLPSGGPVALVGLTSEGGTTHILAIDLSGPAQPVVSDRLRDYYAIGGLAGTGERYVLAAMDGVWVSDDAGSSWERMATGLEDVVLEDDPLVVGIPVDFDPAAVGLFAVAILPDGGMVIGAIDGLYHLPASGDAWTRIDGTAGKVSDLMVAGDGTTVLYVTDEAVHEVPLPA